MGIKLPAWKGGHCSARLEFIQCFSGSGGRPALGPKSHVGLSCHLSEIVE